MLQRIADRCPASRRTPLGCRFLGLSLHARGCRRHSVPFLLHVWATLGRMPRSSLKQALRMFATRTPSHYTLCSDATRHACVGNHAIHMCIHAYAVNTGSYIGVPASMWHHTAHLMIYRSEGFPRTWYIYIYICVVLERALDALV